jgi:hypothetical protein
MNKQIGCLAMMVLMGFLNIAKGSVDGPKLIPVPSTENQKALIHNAKE